MVTLDDDGLAELTWLTPREAAAQARVSQATIYAWVAADRVKVRRHERLTRNGPTMMIELESLLDCEAAMRQGRMGRPRAGTERGEG